MDPNSRLIGRGIYSALNPYKLGFGKEALTGYMQSLNITQSGLTVTIDPSVTAVPVKEDLITWVQVGSRTAPCIACLRSCAPRAVTLRLVWSTAFACQLVEARDLFLSPRMLPWSVLRPGA